MDISIASNANRADPRLIRQINRNALFTAIRNRTSITISELSSQTGLSFSTVNSVLKDLVDMNLVLVTGTTGSTGGRKPVLYSLNLKDRYVCGADIDAHTIWVALLKLDGSIIAKSIVQVENAEPLEIGSLVAATLDELVLKVGTSLDRIIGMGLSQRWMVDLEGIKVRLDVLHGWRDVPLGSMLQQRLPMPVFLIEDTRAKLTAEMEFGSAKNRRNVLYVLIGSPHGEGVSGGFVSDKSVLTGAKGFAGEIGHTLIDPSGPLCSCGRRGCWEAVGDIAHLLARVAALKTDSIEPDARAANPVSGLRDALLRIRIAVEQGNAAVAREFDWFVGIQAEGIANMIHTFNPQHVILGGEVIVLGNVFLASLRSAIERIVMKPFLEGLEFEYSVIEENSALLGASAIVLRQAIAIMERGRK